MEYKDEKEEKKKKTLKGLVKQRLITPKLIDETKLFLWKALIQEYSSLETMCLFLHNNQFLPEATRNRLKNCLIENINPQHITTVRERLPGGRFNDEVYISIKDICRVLFD